MLIELKDIIKNYDNGGVITKVLRGVSLSVDEGEFVAIMGPSGSGKSTLMHTIGFLDKPTSGTYLFDGEDTSSFNDDELARIRNERIGFVFQSFNLLPRTSVLDNVILPLLYNTSKANQESRAKLALESVGLGERIHFMSNQISGGQKQRVAIARALVCDPKVIFADEPTGNIDSKTGQAIIALLRGMHREGKTIIMITHDHKLAKFADRIELLKDGVIVGGSKK